jgi:molybdopterin synthase catalytic subunit
MDPVEVTSRPLALDPLIRLVSNGGSHSAIATFIRTVRDHSLNRRVASNTRHTSRWR